MPSCTHRGNKSGSVERARPNASARCRASLLERNARGDIEHHLRDGIAILDAEEPRHPTATKRCVQRDGTLEELSGGFGARFRANPSEYGCAIRDLRCLYIRKHLTRDDEVTNLNGHGGIRSRWQRQCLSHCYRDNLVPVEQYRTFRAKLARLNTTDYWKSRWQPEQ
jgi:hypothetical protein